MTLEARISSKSARTKQNRLKTKKRNKKIKEERGRRLKNRFSIKGKESKEIKRAISSIGILI
jgi:hypothetical protein